ncbi:hypothetical protein D3C87_1816600 [compost metagenome]
MAAHRVQTQVAEDFLELLRRFAEELAVGVAVKLHFLITDRRHFFQRAKEVFGYFVTKRVQLQTDWRGSFNIQVQFREHGHCQCKCAGFEERFPGNLFVVIHGFNIRKCKK